MIDRSADGGSTTRRLLVVAIAAIVLAGSAAFFLRPERGAPDDAPSQGEMARDVGSAVMTHVKRGHVPGRSGEVLLVPKPHNFLLGEWDMTTLGTKDPVAGSSHPNPWDYLAEVPIVFMGAGVQPGTYDDVVDIADMAPTYARLLGMDDFEVTGRPLPAVDARFGRPRAIFTVVVDGGGWNVLREHPDAWPNMKRLMEQGATYVNGTIGSAPSITGALHATFGTGVYPIDHVIPGNRMRGDEGEDVDAYLENADPRYLDAPTVSELWDERNDNEPIVGTVSYEGWHLGMIGHGAQRDGGDRDIAVLWDQNTEEWFINEDYYRLPSYLQETDIERLESYEEQLDERDALADDAWFGETLDVLQEPNVRPGTPAFVRFTGDAVIDILSNERFGRDGMTDLFWVEMKMPDYTGHRWNMISPQEEDVLEETDRQIGRFIEFLDRNIGRDNYVFGLSADHGQQPLPDISGGWRINNKELERDLEDAFGEIVQKVSTVDLLLDMDEVDRRDIDIDEVARFLGAYTIGDNIPEGAAGADLVPDARLDELLFAGAFTTDFIADLTSTEIERLGEGNYQEGIFPVTQR